MRDTPPAGRKTGKGKGEGKILNFLVRFECQSFVVGKKLEVDKAHKERRKKKINISQLLLISGGVFTWVNILPVHAASPHGRASPAQLTSYQQGGIRLFNF